MTVRSALVNHPFFGSVWLERVRVEDGYVIGEAFDGYFLGHAMYEPMNFPISCVRKWEPGPPDDEGQESGGSGDADG